MRNSRGLKFMVLLAIGVFGLSLISCGGGERADNSNPYKYDLSGLTLGPTPENLLSGDIIVTRTNDGSPATGVYVTLYYRTVGGYGATFYDMPIIGTTDINGKLAVDELLPDNTARKLVFSADNFNTYENFTLGTVPDGFLTGPLSSGKINWTTAHDICVTHGGRLPSVLQLQALFSHSGGNPPDWPTEYPLLYWTTDVAYPASPHSAVDTDGNIHSAYEGSLDSNTYYAVCLF